MALSPASLLSRPARQRLVHRILPANSYALTRLVLPVLIVLVVHGALRMTYPRHVEADDAEMITFSQMPALGYHEMPPLYEWLVDAAFRVFGRGVLALTVVRLGILFAISILLYRTTQLITPDSRAAMLAAHSLLLVPAIAWNALTYLTHSILLIATCLWALAAFLRLVRDGRTSQYLTFGLACGLAGLSKYNAMWFLAALAATGLTIGPARRRLLDWRLGLAAATAALVVLPHALWLLEHLDTIKAVLAYKSTRADTMDDPYFVRMLLGLKAFVPQIALLAVPLVLAVALVFRGSAATSKAPNYELARRLVGRFLLLGLVVLAVQFVGVGRTRIQERWVIHFVAVLPVWLFGRLSPAAFTPGRVRAFAALLIVLAAGYTIARTVQVASPRGTGNSWHPIKCSEDELAGRIAADAGNHCTIITPSSTTGANLLLRLPAARICSASQHRMHPVPPGDEPIVLVWDAALGLQPPWGWFAPLLHVTGTPALPPESIRFVKVADGKPGGSPEYAAYVVLPAARSASVK